MQAACSLAKSCVASCAVGAVQGAWQGLVWKREEKASYGATVDAIRKTTFAPFYRAEECVGAWLKHGGEQLKQSSCSLVSEKPEAPSTTK